LLRSLHFAQYELTCLYFRPRPGCLLLATFDAFVASPLKPRRLGLITGTPPRVTSRALAIVQGCRDTFALQNPAWLGLSHHDFGHIAVVRPERPLRRPVALLLPTCIPILVLSHTRFHETLVAHSHSIMNSTFHVAYPCTNEPWRCFTANTTMLVAGQAQEASLATETQRLASRETHTEHVLL